MKQKREQNKKVGISAPGNGYSAERNKRKARNRNYQL